MRSWSLTHCKLHVSRCDVEKYCLIIFKCPCDVINTFPGKCQYIYCFPVFLLCLSLRVFQAFLSGEKQVVLVFEIIYLFSTFKLFSVVKWLWINSILFKMTKTFRDNCDINIEQQTSCEPLFPVVQMQLKTYFFVPFVRPCMHLNYGVISGSRAYRDCGWHTGAQPGFF